MCSHLVSTRMICRESWKWYIVYPMPVYITVSVCHWQWKFLTIFIIIISYYYVYLPIRHQTITWIRVRSGSIGKNISEISIKIQKFSFTKTHLKTSSPECDPRCWRLMWNGRLPKETLQLCHVSVVTSRIAGNLIVCSTGFRTEINEAKKDRHYWPSVMRTHQWPTDVLLVGPIM